MIYKDEDMPGFAAKAASYVAHRYRKYGVEKDDVQGEIMVWLYGSGKAKVERWLDRTPQQTTRIYRSMVDAGLKYAESEKSIVAGYKPDDVWWYTPGSVEDLLPLALKPSFTQENGHVGNLITMVIDVRRALETSGLTEFFTLNDDTHEDWRINIQLVLDQLGGERPAVGRRRAIRNAQAIAITHGALE